MGALRAFCYAAHSPCAHSLCCINMGLVVPSLACSGQQSRCHRNTLQEGRGTLRHAQAQAVHAAHAGRCAPRQRRQRHCLGVHGVTTPASGCRAGQRAGAPGSALRVTGKPLPPRVLTQCAQADQLQHRQLRNRQSRRAGSHLSTVSTGSTGGPACEGAQKRGIACGLTAVDLPRQSRCARQVHHSSALQQGCDYVS